MDSHQRKRVSCCGCSTCVVPIATGSSDRHPARSVVYVAKNLDSVIENDLNTWRISDEKVTGFSFTCAHVWTTQRAPPPLAHIINIFTFNKPAIPNVSFQARSRSPCEKRRWVVVVPSSMPPSVRLHKAPCILSYGISWSFRSGIFYWHLLTSTSFGWNKT